MERRPVVGGNGDGDVQLGDHDLLDVPLTADALVHDLQPQAGHGTFIAGLVRQMCADARLVSVPLYGPDGVVPEGELLRALSGLVVRQVLARNGRQATGHRGGMVDAVCLSLGYYHERPEDPAFTSLLEPRLRALAMLGVAVFASAGNDATVRPCWPAALAQRAPVVVAEPAPTDVDGSGGGSERVEGGGAAAAAVVDVASSSSPVDDDGVRLPLEHGLVPLVAVGAANPDGSSALFSNDGPWVTAWRPGVSLVSSFPRIDAGLGTDVQVEAPSGMRRTSLDADDYRRGFAVWSGTSFSAPLLAGEFAARLADAGVAPPASEVEEVVDRAWAAIGELEGVEVVERPGDCG